MALQVALSNSIINYTSINLTDNTGDYNVSTNPTGWGAPNTALSAVQYAHLYVDGPTTVDIDIISDLGITFDGSTVIEDLVYNLPYSLLYPGQTDTLIPDGVWTIEYRISTDSDWVEGAGTNSSITVTVMTYYEIQSDVYDRIKLLPNYYTCSDCDNQFVKETSVIFMLLQALIASTQYSNTARFEELLSSLEDIVAFDSENCASCGC